MIPKFIDGTDATEYQKAIAPMMEAAARADPGEQNEPPRPLRFFSDAAHGWLEVPASELVRLGIANDISHYSFISTDGALAYLEEDCDASRYVDALTARGERLPPITDRYEHNSGVRSLRPFAASRMER